MQPMSSKEIKLINEKVERVDNKARGILTEASNDWVEKVKQELADELDMEVDDIEVVDVDSDYVDLEGDGASNGESEWRVYKDEKKARADAIERATDSLQDGAPLSDIIDMGSGPNKGWIKKFMYVTNTDVRLISGEEADRYVEDIKEEDDGERVCDEAGKKRDFEKMKEKIEELEDLEMDGELDKSSARKLDKLRKDLEKLIEKCADKVRDEYAKDLSKRLDKDPVEYAEELGYEDLGDVSWLKVDWDKAGEYVVDTDGIAHTLDVYDGEEINLKSGVAYGTN